MANDITFFWLCFWVYLFAFVLYVFYIPFEKKFLSTFASGLMVLGFIAHTVALLLRWRNAGHAPWTNMYEYVSLIAWFVVAGYMILLFLMRKPIIGAFVAPVSFLLMVSASILPKEPQQQLMPALQSVWLKIHVSVAAAGEGAFAVAFASSILFLLKSGLKPGKGLISRLPSADVLDDVSYKSISIGYPLFTVGAMFAGMIWAYKAWGSFWGWDPKEVSSLVVWAIYTVYLHTRYVMGWKGRRSAVVAIIGFVMAILTFFSNLILGGLHSYT
ncbi:MAG: c-type cytochrome biogenesis protein CcsB [Candidatus Eisenbacteria bacterium]|nr:c-type cytochrome biogenesis protein CcsB [Candidatus Eisenbacteria bacterium]